MIVLPDVVLSVSLVHTARASDESLSGATAARRLMESVPEIVAEA